jgi:hypothetical protein
MARREMRDRLSDTVSRYEAARARLLEAQREYFHGLGGNYDERRQEYVSALRETLECEDELREADPSFSAAD